LENPSTVDVGIEVLDVKVLDLDHGVLPQLRVIENKNEHLGNLLGTHPKNP
jgi:hypothetical protein